MFSQLTQNIASVVKKITGKSKLTEENIQDALREVRIALLEADVAFPVIKLFLDQVREKALGQEVLTNINPSQAFIKIVHDELVTLMGQFNETLQLNTQPPAVILMAGLQGSGKTTTTGKLARYLKETQKKSVLVTSGDIYRPAAIKQLETLAQQLGIEFYPSDTSQSPITIAKNAIQAAKQKLIDVVIIDTAGRLHIDEDMMREIREIHAAAQPIETLFVVDSMTGQDAANTAKAFNDALPLTGVILTKTDGDARGGAALSIRHITGKPIKFIGAGEKLDALQPFYPERIASRILGMGDIVSLVEEAHAKIDEAAAKKAMKKLNKGRFDLEDYRDQLLQMNKLGGVASLLDKLPGAATLPSQLKNTVNDKMFGQVVAIINSMTPQERRFPDIIRGSRKRRISAGSGTQVQDVNRLLKQFLQMQKMMKKMSGRGGMMRMLGQMKNMLPPGGLPSQ